MEINRDLLSAGSLSKMLTAARPGQSKGENHELSSSQ